jgi:ubiquinone/menaquinone biosynthesis C-methylase UbiE
MDDIELPVWSEGRPHGPIAEPLLPLRDAHPKLRGTEAIVASGVTGITSQFRDNAPVYDERYFDSGSKRVTIERALELIQAKLPADTTALDIGCGSGNATFAIFKLFRDARVYATDLSPELLTILIRRANEDGLLDRITPFVADASSLRLADRSFDLIVGSSMVHHLMDPEGFMCRILRSVRSGGAAIFFEPFQAGFVVVRQLLAMFVSLAPTYPGLSERRVKFFRDYLFTIDTLMRQDRDNPIFAQLDDKWMFTRKLFQRVAEQAGCRVEIFSTNPPRGLFRRRITDLLYKGLGDQDPLPDWMLKILDETDANISPELSEELLMEACIVFSC